MTPDNSLRVAKVTRSSEGVYFCQAFNPVTRDARTSRMATVTVRGWQVLLILFFLCGALYQWLKNDPGSE